MTRCADMADGCSEHTQNYAYAPAVEPGEISA